MKNRHNFYNKTKGTFVGCKPPKRAPDYISTSRYYNTEGEVSSKYWYTAEGVYRMSDHWSDAPANTNVHICRDIASCWWVIKTNSKSTITCGFCPWWKFKNRH